jgi:hypothetical protein
VGEALRGRDQTTAWPRRDAWDYNGDLVTGVPPEVKEAANEYGLRALSAALAPDPDRDASGARVQSKSQTVGPISQSFTFVSGAAFTMPKYPSADNKLFRSGLAMTGGRSMRA